MLRVELDVMEYAVTMESELFEEYFEEDDLDEQSRPSCRRHCQTIQPTISINFQARHVKKLLKRG